jgi:hypothetical protein
VIGLGQMLRTGRHIRASDDNSLLLRLA